MQKHRQNIQVLTQTISISLNDRNISNQKIIAKSTAGPLCSFGLEINAEHNDEVIVKSIATIQLNEKKRQKLELDLAKLLKTVDNEGYRKSANEKVQARHKERVSGFFYVKFLENYIFHF